MKPVVADNTAIDDAVDLLRKGFLVAFPTETVYGLGADAANPEAVQKIFKAKRRPADHPLIVHLSSQDQLDDWALHVPETARLLAACFWPGPLTLILNKKPEVPLAVTGGQQTVALRVPDHPVALRLLRKFGGGVAAPSANRFCRISPTQAVHVEEELGNDVDLILDGGPCPIGVESTILDLSGQQPRMLRPGGITLDALEDLLSTKVNFDPVQGRTDIRAPGLMNVHYAPDTPAFLCSAEQMPEIAGHWVGQGKRIGLLSYRQCVPEHPQIHQIRMPLEAGLYARALYGALRELDRLRAFGILVEEPPKGNDWQAINDRLRKAAARL